MLPSSEYDHGYVVCRFVSDVSLTHIVNLCALSNLDVYDDRDPTVLVSHTVRPRRTPLRNQPTVAVLERIEERKLGSDHYLIGILSSKVLEEELGYDLRKRKQIPYMVLSRICSKVRKQDLESVNEALHNKPMYVRLTSEHLFDLTNSS